METRPKPPWWEAGIRFLFERMSSLECTYSFSQFSQQGPLVLADPPRNAPSFAALATLSPSLMRKSLYAAISSGEPFCRKRSRAARVLSVAALRKTAWMLAKSPLAFARLLIDSIDAFISSF